MDFADRGIGRAVGRMQTANLGMRNFFLILAFLSAGSSTFGQGRYILSNYTWPDVNAPIYDASGVPLYGTDYLAELYGGPTPDSLSPGREEGVIVPYRVPFDYTPGGKHGYFGGSSFVTIDGIVPGQSGYLQVRAWDVRLGSSYEEVVSRNMGGYGASSIF